MVRNFGFADFLFPRVNVTVFTREEEGYERGKRGVDERGSSFSSFGNLRDGITRGEDEYCLRREEEVFGIRRIC